MARLYIEFDRRAYLAAHSPNGGNGGNPNGGNGGNSGNLNGGNLSGGTLNGGNSGNPNSGNVETSGAGQETQGGVEHVEGCADFPLEATSSLALRFGTALVRFFRERVEQESEESNVVAMLNALDLLAHLLGAPFLRLAMPTLSSLELLLLDYNAGSPRRADA